MLSAIQLGIARPRFIKSSEKMSRQNTIDSLLLSVAAGQPSHAIASVCSIIIHIFFSNVADCIVHAY